MNPWLLPALFAGATGFVVALWIFVRGPGLVQHRALAMLVWTTSFGWAVMYGLAAFSPAAIAPLVPGSRTGYFAWGLAVLSYLWLISTLQGPLARRLARRPVRWTYTAVLTAVAVVYGTTPWLAASTPIMAPSTWFDLLWMTVILVGIVAALSAWKGAPPGLLRRRNGFYALAFIVHDVSLLFFLGGSALLVDLFPQYGHLLGDWWLLVPGAATLLFQGLLLYGILNTQLFDIDLKLRWGVSRGTMGAIFVAAFFAASETAAALLTPKLGVVAGIFTTAGLIVALAPLRRASDALAGWLVRDAVDTPSYRKRRKEMVYQAQVEELMADGTISVKERRALLRLQETLVLDAAVAARLERDVLDRLMPAVVLVPQAEA